MYHLDSAGCCDGVLEVSAKCLTEGIYQHRTHSLSAGLKGVSHSLHQLALSLALALLAEEFFKALVGEFDVSIQLFFIYFVHNSI